MPRTDAELLIASRDDARAFRELYDRWAERLLAYFYRRVLDAEVAGDLLAETFAVAFERRRRFRDVGAPGAAWLYGIAAKELAHWFRRQEVERRAIRRLAIEVPPLDDEAGLRALAAERFTPSGRAIEFTRWEPPDGVQVGVSGPDGQPKQEGCATFAGVGPAEDGVGIVVEIDP